MLPRSLHEHCITLSLAFLLEAEAVKESVGVRLVIKAIRQCTDFPVALEPVEQRSYTL